MPQTLPPATLVMFAGMGASTLFVAPQKRAFGDAMIVPEWPKHRRREPIGEYARRWAADLAPRLPANQPIVLAGVSFGGMIAQEMAPWLRPRPRAVLLVASGRSGAAVAPFWRGLERVLSPVPWKLATPIAPLIGYAHGVQMGLGRAHRRLLARVARRLDLTLTQWCAYGVTHWPGLPPGRATQLPPVPVRAIHGDRDPLMPLRLADADTVVPGGRHLIHLSHADTVNAWLGEHTRRAIEETPPP